MRDKLGEESLAKALGGSVDFETSDSALKIKRNLLLVSIVIIVLIMGEVSPSPKVSIFGVTLDNVTADKLMIGLSAFLIYAFLHYGWCCFDLMGEWFVRVTGARIGFITGGTFGHPGMDYPKNPKDSTLYAWWVDECKRLPTALEQFEKIKEIHEKINESKALVDLPENDGVVRINHQASAQMLMSSVNMLHDRLSSIDEIMNSPRVHISLERFDHRFGLLKRSQNLRVLITEIIFPLFLALFAFGLLKVYFFS